MGTAHGKEYKKEKHKRPTLGAIVHCKLWCRTVTVFADPFTGCQCFGPRSTEFGSGIRFQTLSLIRDPDQGFSVLDLCEEYRSFRRSSNPEISPNHDTSLKFYPFFVSFWSVLDLKPKSDPLRIRFWIRRPHVLRQTHAERKCQMWDLVWMITRRIKKKCML
jgi:hypothetical protein